MTTSSSVEGRTYLVTGSASGIGAATAALITGGGGKVIGCDLENADIEIDLSTTAGRASLVEQATRLGPIDAVLAIAGGGRRGIIETNFFGTVATLEGLRPLLAKSDAPRAVAISSTASLAPPNQEVVMACLEGDEARAVQLAADAPPDGPGPYGWAKRALNRWVRRVAATPEWAGAGIPLNVVAPGVVDTPAAAWIFESEETRNAVESAAPQPLGGFPGRPEWISDAILWLASPGNAFVTGQIIFADGGSDAATVGDVYWSF
jgi:NAD(P)-dependent dehydrogenase (short-subunit alcohol dehydrogenase family)